MPNWNESEYLKRAAEIAHIHVASKKTINDISEKYARDNNMNPDEIRTLVRLSNVATFQEIFKNKSQDSDRMVDFEVGEPEAVIRRIVDAANTPSESANIHNDKLASEVPDMMRLKRFGQLPVVEDLTVKIAHEEPEKLPRQDMVILNLEKLAADFEVERIIEGNKWEQKLAQLAAAFKKAPGYGPDFSEFEKDAYAVHAEDAVAELTLVRQLCKMSAQFYDPAAICNFRERRVVENSPELSLLKEAVDAREAYLKYVGGLSWISKNMPEVSL